MTFWTTLGTTLLAQIPIVVPLIVGAALTLLTTWLLDSRAARRAELAARGADQAARFEAGQEDARKSLKLTQKLMRTVNSAYPSQKVPFAPDPLRVDRELSDKLALRVRLIPDSAVAERLTWLIRAGVDPQIYSPEPLLTNFPMFQMQCFGLVADELARFIRRDSAVYAPADELAKNVGNAFLHKWQPADTRKSKRSE
jgi:hypothetical protein